MKPLLTLRARRLARPHLLALAAALALPVTVGAQATNNWRCAGGAWTGDPVCWSLGTPNSTQNVAIPAGPTGSDLMLLTAIGNTVSVRSLAVGGERTEPSSAATASLFASGSTINVTSGNVAVGVARNAYGQLALTNSTLNVNGLLEVGQQPSATAGFGALSVQANSRINGNVDILNGRIDVFGSTNAAYSAVSGYVGVYDNGVANIAGGLNQVVMRGGRALVGTTSTNLATPVLNIVQNQSGSIDFVGRSRVGLTALFGGVSTVRAGATVESAGGNPSGLRLFSGSQLVVESSGQLRTETALNEGNVQLVGGELTHTGFTNAGTVTGAGRVGANGAAAFVQQANGFVIAKGGDLTIESRFDGSAGGTIGTQNGRLFFYGDTRFKAGQVITQGGSDSLIAFRNKVEIGNAMERGSFEAMMADLALQSTSNLLLDFAGVTDHDYLATAGRLLVEGGKLTLGTAGSFQAGVGSFFNIFRATSGITGIFSSIDTTAFALAPGARLDFSNLYTTGTVAVVPEPATWLSLGAGLLLIGARARRWRPVS